MNFPLNQAFLDRISRQLGSETPAYLAAMDSHYVRGIRYNTLRHPKREDRSGTDGNIPWAGPEAYYLKYESDAGTSVMHEAGVYYLQEPSAMLPAMVMHAVPGERILDLCAAPGGKSTQIGCDLQGRGVLVCNEPVPKRAAVLSGNIERMGITNAVVTCSYPEQLANRWEGWFDGVQADVPCSGEGMFRRHPEARNEWTPEMAEGCAGRQREILLSAARMVKPGGRLIYSTCTLNPAENEENIAWFLRNRRDFSLAPFSLPEIDGRTGMFTCWPQRLRGEGQFVARLVRDGQHEISEEKTPRTEQFGKTRVRIAEYPDISGIRVLRLGLHLGENRGSLFIPDHAAVMAEETDEATRTEVTDEQALHYLAGEMIPGDIRGWTAVYWNGVPLGWGKGSDGMIKNHYPKGLRKQRLTIG